MDGWKQNWMYGVTFSDCVEPFRQTPDINRWYRSLTHVDLLGSDLGEDAGSGSDPAVHHAVENGQQAVQREGLGPQEVVAGLKNSDLMSFTLDTAGNNRDSYLFIFLQEVCFSYFSVVLEGEKRHFTEILNSPTGREK